jgi:hypothetical protein
LTGLHSQQAVISQRLRSEDGRIFVILENVMPWGRRHPIFRPSAPANRVGNRPMACVKMLQFLAIPADETSNAINGDFRGHLNSRFQVSRFPAAKSARFPQHLRRKHLRAHGMKQGEGERALRLAHVASIQLAGIFKFLKCVYGFGEESAAADYFRRFMQAMLSDHPIQGATRRKAAIHEAAHLVRSYGAHGRMCGDPWHILRAECCSGRASAPDCKPPYFTRQPLLLCGRTL